MFLKCSIVPKIISDENKKNMIEDFKKGFNLEDLSIKYGLKELTIKKHLKKLLTEAELKGSNKNISEKESITNNTEKVLNSKKDKSSIETKEEFYEIIPLSEEIDFTARKDLATKSLKEFNLPNNTYMIINNKTELEIHLIRDFPEFSFLSENDQECKTIKLFSEKKIASSFCSKNQKIIKVPNGDVFKLSSPFLLKKGISRIIYDEYLLSI